MYNFKNQLYICGLYVLKTQQPMLKGILVVMSFPVQDFKSSDNDKQIVHVPSALHI